MINYISLDISLINGYGTYQAPLCLKNLAYFVPIIEPTGSQHPVPKGGEFSAWCITGGPHYYSLSLAI